MTKKVAKTVPFKMAPAVIQPAEQWVASREVPEEGRESATVTPIVPVEEPMKRFTIDVSEGLHKRIKAQCAMRGVKMADIIRNMLDKEFPAT